MYCLPLIVACALSGSTTLPPSEFSEYFPMRVGTRLTLRFESQPSPRSDTELMVTDVKRAGNVAVVTVSQSYTIDWSRIFKSPDDPAPRLEKIENPFQKYRVAEDGVFVIAEYDLTGMAWKDLKTPRCLMRLPPTEGSQWEDRDAESGIHCVNTVGKRVRVKVVAGTFDAYVVESKQTKKGQLLSERKFWYAPGMGMIKSEINGESGMELISFVLV
ncbi:MAG: hypothetical protein U0791_02100 [Gemmataceae bacterium]